jgi:hypothetical protein
MEIILHTGVHRTATTSFQNWLVANSQALAEHGTAIWETQVTRSERFRLFALPVEDRGDTAAARQDAAKMLRREFAELAEQGYETLLISEENLLGGVRRGLSKSAIYPEAAERLARLQRLFGDRITRFAFGLRDYCDYWTSCIGLLVARGDAIPFDTDFSRLAANPRGWPDLSRDINDAFPTAKQTLWTFDRFKADPLGLLTAILGRAPVPRDVTLTAPLYRNFSPKGDALRAILGEGFEYTPEGNLAIFAPEEAAALKTRYAADLAWFGSQTTSGFTYLD